MFQSFKRAGFLAKNNFQHWQVGDCVQLHLWLQKNGWPANEFVDLFMRCHLNFDPDFDALGFKLFMEDQFNWVSEQDVEALDHLIKLLDTPKFRGVDKDHLLEFALRQAPPRPVPPKQPAPVEKLPAFKSTYEPPDVDSRPAAPIFKLVSISYDSQNVTPVLNLMEIQALGAHIYAGLQGHGCAVNNAPDARLRVTGSFGKAVPQEFVFYAQSLFAIREGAWFSYELPAHIANLWHLRFR